jgi:hypothetical protein
VSIRVHFLDDERKALYGEIFPDGVPVSSPLPSLCQLNGAGEYECYMLDVQECGPTQLAKLGASVARKFKADAEAVMTAMLSNGMPIRSDQTTLVVDGPHLGLLMPDAVGHFDDLHQLEEAFGSVDGYYVDDYYDDEAEYEGGNPEKPEPPDNVNEIPF